MKANQRCPKCNDDASDFTATSDPGSKPTPGHSIMICLYCQAVLRYTENDDLIAMTEAELQSIIITDPGLSIEIIKAITVGQAALHRKRRKFN